MTGINFCAVVHQAGSFARVIDIQGEISMLSSSGMSEAFSLATKDEVRNVILNFSGVSYLNSFGIGVLVTLLIRARREEKNIIGYGLAEHYRDIFKLTRLDEVLPLYENEEKALASIERYTIPEKTVESNRSPAYLSRIGNAKAARHGINF